MKRMIVLVLGAMLGVTGCLTVEKAQLPGADSGNQVFVRNYGKYLFNLVPIWCGNANENPKCDFVMFRDDVTMDKMQHRFLSECHKVGTEITDINCFSEDDIFLLLPIWSLEIPIPYLWTTHEIQISGTVK